MSKVEETWFNAYQEVDDFLFEQLDKKGKEFPIINENKPQLNTIEAIKILLKEQSDES